MWRERSEEREEFLEPNLSEGREAGPSGSCLQRGQMGPEGAPILDDRAVAPVPDALVSFLLSSP